MSTHYSSLKKIFFISLTLIFSAESYLSASSKTWIGVFSNQWNDKKNWNGNSLPSDGDDISFQPAPMNEPIITAANASAFIPRDIIIQNIATLTMTGGNLTLTGNWINDGTFYAFPGSAVTLGGSSQRIEGTAPTIFYDLNISLNSSSNSATLSSTISVTNTLFLNRGWLDLNGNVLTIANPSPNAISRIPPSFIKCEKNSAPYGELKWVVNDQVDTYLFPFGKSEDAGDFIPFIFNILSAGSSAGTVSVSTYSTSGDNLPWPAGVTTLNSGNVENSPNVVDRFWIIDLQGYSANPEAEITFTYTDSEVPANGEDDLKAQRWSGTKWELPEECVPGGQAAVVSSNTVTTSAISQFSPWTLSRQASPLPVAFLNFNAREEGEIITLYWSTATEINNAFFTVQRSNDGYHFENICTIKGAGNSSSVRNYQYMDIYPRAREYGDAVFYYRIKQTDVDGKYDYSGIIAVRCSNKSTFLNIYPNPSHSKNIFLRGRIPCAQEIRISIRDLAGREQFSKTCKCDHFISETIEVEKQLSEGIYFVSAGSETDFFIKRLVIQ